MEGGNLTTCIFRILTPGIILLLCAGCSGFWGRHQPPPEPSLTVAVGPIVMDASIDDPSQISSFENSFSPGYEQTLLQQLLNEIETRAQKTLTERLSDQPGFKILPFQQIRRIQADLVPTRRSWTEEELQALGRYAQADVVLSGRIVAYGFIPWKYIAMGLATETTAEFLAVGLASGFNPAVLGTFFAVDVLLVDAPIWFGGAYLFGWAFRPVHVEAQGIQLASCEGEIWHERDSTLIIPKHTMEEYPPEQRARKEVQLQVNLDQAMANIAEAVGQTLRLRPCSKEGTPIDDGSWFSWLWP